jgi:hypothetical protein
MTTTGSTPFPIPFQVTPAGFSGIDWDFAMPIGNLVWAGNDHGGGSGLVVHRPEPDTTGPTVTMVNPRDGSTFQPTHSRVGLVFGDLIDGRSLSTESIIVRPVGGSAVPGSYSVQLGVVNFWPDEPLLPDTTYEVVVPAGGVTDVSGNGALPFTSQFTTSGIEPALIVDTTTLAVPEGGTAAFTVRLAQAPAGSVRVTTTRTAGDGDLSLTAGAALTFTETTWDIPQAVVVAAAPDADGSDGAATLSLYAIGHAGAAVRLSEQEDTGGGGEENQPPTIPLDAVAEPADLAL